MAKKTEKPSIVPLLTRSSIMSAFAGNAPAAFASENESLKKCCEIRFAPFALCLVPPFPSVDISSN